MGASSRGEQEEARNISAFISHLVSSGAIDDDRAVGIAKQVADRGEESLSDKQRHIYEKYVEPLFPDKCGRCNNAIQSFELIEIFDGGVCTDCHVSEKSMPD